MKIKNMKIGIDIRCLSEGRRTGVEEYSLNLLEKILKEDNDNKYVLFLNSWKKPKLEIDFLKNHKNVELKISRFPNKILNFFLWYFNWPKLDKLIGGVDVFFMPNLNFVALSLKVKLILTVHDLSFEYYPETFSWKRRLWHIFINPQKIIRRADKVLAVSDSTRNDLIGFYKINPAKVETVYNGVGEVFGRIDRNDPRLLKIKEKYALPFNFILFLGTFEPRKNIGGIVKAYERMRQEGGSQLEKYKLVIAGSEGWKSAKLKREIKKSSLAKDIYQVKFIDEEDKVFVYNLAALFVYPSFFEGFGLPPLEAIKCGVPVIVSDNSSMVETVGEAGILTDAFSADEIALAMKEFLIDKELKNEFYPAGIRQAQKFTWTKAAKKFLEIVKKI